MTSHSNVLYDVLCPDPTQKTWVGSGHETMYDVDLRLCGVTLEDVWSFFFVTLNNGTWQ